MTRTSEASRAWTPTRGGRSRRPAARPCTRKARATNSPPRKRGVRVGRVEPSWPATSPTWRRSAGEVAWPANEGRTGDGRKTPIDATRADARRRCEPAHRRLTATIQGSPLPDVGKGLGPLVLIRERDVALADQPDAAPTAIGDRQLGKVIG